MNTANRRTRSAVIAALMGVIALVIISIVVVGLFLRRTSGPPQQALCAGNLHRIGIAMEMYKNAWNDGLPVLSTSRQRAPEGRAWPDLLIPYLDKMNAVRHTLPANPFRCPQSTGDRMTCSFNRRLQGLSIVGMNQAESILVFESVNDSPGNRNLNGDTVSHPTAEWLPASGTFVAWPSDEESYYQDWPEWARMRHQGTNNVLWADGHVSSRDAAASPSFDPAKSPKEE